MDPTLATLLTISVTVIAATLVLFLIFLIPFLHRGRQTAHEAERLFDSMRLRVAPVSHDVTAISLEVKSVIKSIHRQVDRVESGIETAQDMAVLAKEFQIEVQRRIEEPLLQLAAVISGVKRGIEGIASILRR